MKTIDVKTIGLDDKVPFTFAFLDSTEKTVIRAEIKGPIGYRFEEADGTFYGETSASFLNAVAEQKAQNPEAKWIEIDLNTPGGVFTEAVAIYTGLATSGLKVRYRTVGLSASAGAYLAVCGDEHFIAEDAQMMIHQASGGVYGSASKISSYAESVEQVNAAMIKRFTDKSGKSEEEVSALIDGKDYWMTGLDAVALGFADGTIEPLGITACANAEELRALNAPEAVIEQVEAEENASEEGVEDEVIVEAEAETIVVEDKVVALSEEAQEEIKAACALMDMSDKADSFIEARVDINEVRAALFKARADKQSENDLDTRDQPASAQADIGVVSLSAARNAVIEAQRAMRK